MSRERYSKEKFFECICSIDSPRKEGGFARYKNGVVYADSDIVETARGEDGKPVNAYFKKTTKPVETKEETPDKSGPDSGGKGDKGGLDNG